jgi:hypothetical protein
VISKGVYRPEFHPPPWKNCSSSCKVGKEAENITYTKRHQIKQFKEISKVKQDIEGRKKQAGEKWADGRTKGHKAPCWN